MLEDSDGREFFFNRKREGAEYDHGMIIKTYNHHNC